MIKRRGKTKYTTKRSEFEKSDFCIQNPNSDIFHTERDLTLKGQKHLKGKYHGVLVVSFVKNDENART